MILGYLLAHCSLGGVWGSVGEWGERGGGEGGREGERGQGGGVPKVHKEGKHYMCANEYVALQY